MAEYIPKEALQAFPIRENHCDKEHANEHFICGIETVMEYAEGLPAADVAPVVRCKDCKYFTRKLIVGDWCENPDGLPSPHPDAFCSYDERKEPVDV